MRIALCSVVVVALVASHGLGQTPPAQVLDRNFYLTSLTSSRDLSEVAGAFRNVIEIQTVQTEDSRHALMAHGTVDQMVAAEWLLHELDQPAAATRIAASAIYKMGGANGEVLQVFRLHPSATSADLTSLNTAIRTVADVQKLFPVLARNAMIARSTPEKVAAAEWLFSQLTPPDGHALAGDSSLYPMPPQRAGWPAEAIRVLRLNPSASNAMLTSVVSAIRTVADIQRLMPFEPGHAIVVRDANHRMAVAEWLVHQLNNPSPDARVAGFTMTFDPIEPRDSRDLDDAVRLFYVHASDTQLASLTTQIRARTGIARLMPLTLYSAIALRGRTDHMSTVQSLIDQFETPRIP